VRTLLKDAEAARAIADWKTAAELFGRLMEGMEKGTGNGALDPYILQQLALATYKSDGSEAGLRRAHAVLQKLHPETSKDPETLGIWGAIHKRLWARTQDRAMLDEAVQAYETAFSVRNDHYSGTNYAYILDVRASVTEGDDAVADRVTAKRVRQRVIAECQEQLKEPELKPAERYWAEASMAEAFFGIGETEKSRSILAEAETIAPEQWMVQSTTEEMQKLAKVLAAAAG
jgi:tetratricopeptide (TPR) repeat protein